MGRASRRKREQREAPPIDTIEMAVRADEYRHKQWPASVLRALLPEGEKAVATRYDPRADVFHIACESGLVLVVDRMKLVRAESVDAVVEHKPSPDLPPSVVAKQLRDLEDAWRDYQEQQQRECRCVPPGEEGSPDAPPCEQHPNGDGRQPKPGQPDAQPPPSFADQWEMAEARLAEYLIANAAIGTVCVCQDGDGHPFNVHQGSCSYAAEVLLRPIYWNNRPVPKATAPMCSGCARHVLKLRPDLLDWNPDA